MVFQLVLTLHVFNIEPPLSLKDFYSSQDISGKRNFHSSQSQHGQVAYGTLEGVYAQRESTASKLGAVSLGTSECPNRPGQWNLVWDSVVLVLC